MRTARVVTGCSSASSSPLEGLLFDRYRGKKTRAALSKLAKRVEDHSLEVQRQQQRQPIVVDGGLEVSGVSDLEAIDAKLDLLDSLKFGLGYSVLQRYPIEFLDESAFELWSILAAVLFTTGFSPESIGTLFKKHPCLFASAVRSPENVKNLFEWMREQGIVETNAVRVVNRFPLILQADVGSCLEPRVAFFVSEFGMPREHVIASIVRHPELLSVESAWLQKRISYYCSELGLGQEDLRALFRSQPSAFAVDVERYLVPMTSIMREFDFSSSAVVKSGLLSRSVETVQNRIRAWNELGMTKDDLRIALRRFPRLLCYPVGDAKYQEKLAFLTGELGVDVPTAVRSFPAVMSYSLEQRIRPRVLAVKNLTGKTPTLQQLAMREADYLRKHGVDQTTYAAFVKDMHE